jgi:transglutaminase-like putative cysteine protease
MLKKGDLNHQRSRRRVLSATTCSILLFAACRREIAFPTIDDHTGETKLQMKTSNEDRIRELAIEITVGATTPLEAAVSIHRWVRDEIAFGIPAKFYDMTASEVLDAKLGFCNTKTTLFRSLLSACSIGTRLRMVDLSAQVLQGLFDPGTPFVDHAITEVQLAGQWHSVDSYVVDLALAKQARTRLAASGAEIGFGIHRLGSSDWNGATDSLIQAFGDRYINRQHGYFDDIADFYARTPHARNRRTFATGLFVRLGANSINRTIDRVRRGL